MICSTCCRCCIVFSHLSSSLFLFFFNDPATTEIYTLPYTTLFRSTDAKGRAQLQFPDGTITRLANNTQIAINSSHFAKDGHVHDISVTDKVGRTLNSVQKLVGGATFQVVGNTTTASVRGTLFEVLVNADGTVVIKLFIGGLDVDGKSGHVHLTEGQQVTVDAKGNIGAPGRSRPTPTTRSVRKS